MGFASVLRVTLTLSQRHPEASLSTLLTERECPEAVGSQAPGLQGRAGTEQACGSADWPAGLRRLRLRNQGDVLISWALRQPARSYSGASIPVRNGHRVETGRGRGGVPLSQRRRSCADGCAADARPSGLPRSKLQTPAPSPSELGLRPQLLP